jgi:hypothetical protein
MKQVFLLLALAVALGGCVSTSDTESLKPVCEALGPPHRYNAHTLTSPTHAGPMLAQRLARDNAVGEGLPCPGY